MHYPIRQYFSKLFLLTAGIAGALLAAAPLAAQEGSQRQANSQEIRNWNTRILQLHAELLNANGGSRASIRSLASPLFRQRAAALAALMKTDPESVLNTALSPELLQTLAAAFPGADLEQQGEFTGLAEHIVFDDDSLTQGRSEIRMKVGDEWVNVHFQGDAPDLSCNDVIRVRGVKLGTELAAADGVSSGALGTTSTCATMGTQYVAVLLVTFPGVTPPAGVTPQVVNDIFFHPSNRSVNTFWREASQGKTSAQGRVFGWLTLPASFNCSDHHALRDAAIRAADGLVDFRTFNRLVIIFPPAPGCGWAGLGTVGCTTLYSPKDGYFTSSVAWMNASYFKGPDPGVKLATHEGGHNFGLRHARTFDYGTVPLGELGTRGTVSEYGSNFSTMGGWNFGHYSTPDKIRLKWFDTTTHVPNIQSNGVFTIAPFEQATPGRQALRIRRGLTGSSWLLLEYRQPVGLFDTALNPQAFTGALVHYEDGSSTNSNLLDFTPATTSWTDPALAAGQSWSDPYTNLSLQVQSATPSGLTVSVTYGAAPCVVTQPTVVISPSNPSGLPGAQLSYTVTVTNRDSASCPPATFIPSSTAPSSWLTTYSTAGLTVYPGATASFTMTKTIPSGTPAATYAANAIVSDARHSQTAAASATVTALPPPPPPPPTTTPPPTTQPPTAQPPATTTGLAATLTGPTSAVPVTSAVTMTVRALLNSVVAPNASVLFRVDAPNGIYYLRSATTGTLGTASYAFKVSQLGTYTVRATVTAGSLTVTTASYPFVVN